MTPRHRKNALSFLDAVAHAKGAPRLGPIGYLQLSNMQLLGLKIGGGQQAIATLTPLQQRDQIHAFMWLQIAPLDQVSRGIRQHERLRTELGDDDAAFVEFMVQVVEPWLADVPVEAIEQAMAQLDTLDEIDAASVVARPPADATPEAADPN